MPWAPPVTTALRAAEIDLVGHRVAGPGPADEQRIGEPESDRWRDGHRSAGYAATRSDARHLSRCPPLVAIGLGAARWTGQFLHIVAFSERDVRRRLLVAGVSGFAFALIAAAVWLHVLTPLSDRVPLIHRHTA